VPARIGPDTIFTQVCGWPLQTIYAGQAIVLACQSGTTYCADPTHVGVFVVRRDAPFGSVTDLRGYDFLFNSLHSNSGMNLPRRVIAELAGGRPFFRSIVETHGHPA
jgi:ABC-type phosphate/phosphonate transport system substrate-binding protein